MMVTWLRSVIREVAAMPAVNNATRTNESPIAGSDATNGAPKGRVTNPFCRLMQ
jgi:hypothetical protein